MSKYPETCRHFTGIQHKTCAAGVEYLPLRDKPPGAGMACWPCLRLAGEPAARTTCPQRVLMTDEALAKIEAGRCHVCDAMVTSRERVGRCLYARPCGHRIGQGGCP